MGSTTDRRIILLTALLLTAAALGCAQADFVIQPSPPLDSLNLPKALTDQLDSQGSRLLRSALTGATKPICDVWWVKSVPTEKPPTATSGILYGNLPVGTLVGLFQSLSPETEDFRDQKLKPGLYTMRYARIPQDEYPDGASRYQDFLLLSPVSADAGTNSVLGYADLLRFSRMASGTAHPAAMSLVPANPSYKKLPSAVADDRGFCSIQVHLHEQSPTGIEDAPLSLLVVTPEKEHGGS